MPVGLQVFDDYGNALIDTSTRITQIFGKVSIALDLSNGTGSLVDPRLKYGTPFFFIQQDTNKGTRDGYIDGRGFLHGFYTGNMKVIYPYETGAFNLDVTFNNDTMSWKVYKCAREWYKEESAPVFYYGCY